MASKKYALMLSLVTLLSTSIFAQNTDWGYDWKDTARVMTTKVPQHNEFLNNQYPYPGKPRSMWEIGFGIGATALAGDDKPNTGFSAMLSARKALGHVMSVRPYLAYSSNKGSFVGYLNPAILQGGSANYSYKNNTLHIGMDLLTSLNTISNYRGNPKTNIYLVTGVEYFSPNVEQSVNGSAFRDFNNPSLDNEFNNKFGLNLGIGTSFKISKRANFGLEVRSTFTNNDYLDSYTSVFSGAYDSWVTGMARLNFNLGNAAKRTEPLWWLNSNNFVYNELNSPKHMKMPAPVLPDADNDGVTDQFDLEPNTPQGAPVDSRGRAKDSDGDGVPDYKDKELLTPQKCFPVNADGIGKCPEPECCKELRDKIANWKPEQKAECTLGNLPSVQFKGTATKLSKDAEAVLSAAAASINANPNCKVKVIGYGASDKRSQQRSWDRVNAVIRFLVEKRGVAENRFIFTYGQNGDANTVDLQTTTEGGPNTVPAPHPNLKSKN